jgi:hypothetical protein
MNEKDINNWIMYHEIHKLSRMGFSSPKIARYVVMDSRTVRKYLNMTEQEGVRGLPGKKPISLQTP